MSVDDILRDSIMAADQPDGSLAIVRAAAIVTADIVGNNALTEFVSRNTFTSLHTLREAWSKHLAAKVPQEYKLLTRIVELGGIPLEYLPGGVFGEDNYIHECLSVYIHRDKYDNIRSVFMDEPDTVYIVDSDYERTTRKIEELNEKVDKARRRPVIVARKQLEIMNMTCTYDDRPLVHLNNELKTEIVNSYLCVHIKAALPKFSTHVLELTSVALAAISHS